MTDQRLAAAEEKILKLEVKVDALEQLHQQMRRKYARLLERVEGALGAQPPTTEAAQQAAEEARESEGETEDEEGEEEETGGEGENEDEEQGEDDDEEYNGDEDEEVGEPADPHPFKCTRPGCHFEYALRAYLDQHMANTHNSNPATRKPHVCPACPASYDTAPLLRAHARLHDPASRASRRPVPGGCICPVAGCGRVCKSLVYRRDHLARSHKGWRKAHPGWKNE